MSGSRVQAARLFVAASRPYSCLTPRAIVQLNKFQHGSRPPASVLVETGTRSFSSCGHQRREQLSDVTGPRDGGLSGHAGRRWSVSSTSEACINPLTDTSLENINSSTHTSANNPSMYVLPNVISSTYTSVNVNPLTYTPDSRHNTDNAHHGSDGRGHTDDSAHHNNKSSDSDHGPHTDDARGRAGAMAVAAAAVAALGVCCTQTNCDARNGPILDIFPKLHAKALKKNPDELQMSGLKLNHRERRFIKFASVEFHGQLYMTPQDFIESVTDSEPRQRLRRRQLTQGDLDKFYQHTPPLRKGTSRMFREIYDKGIMSYTEYLFLLSILTKPQTGFHIAFNMFDTDGNERVDKQEFLVLESIFSTARRERLQRTDSATAEAEAGGTGALDDSLQKKHQVDTTLLVHFFGQKGRQDLKFEDFKMFMENLQTEVLEIEFNEFSKGLPTISELDFAKILLRYTHLQADQYEMYLERLIDKLSEEKGITFPEFKSFCQFLNTLEDFGIAMRMYTLAEQPISQEEFHRAVRICTGHSLSPHIVATVYNIFDDDGDGQLSYKEFIAIMKDRLHRGFKGDEVKASGMAAFRNCLLRAIRT